jgi:hypothetical protein
MNEEKAKRIAQHISENMNEEKLKGIAEKMNEMQKEMVPVQLDLLTNKYTTVFQEKEFTNNAPHHFKVLTSDLEQVLAEVNFQNGPILEAGINGVMNEDLIAMVIVRLKAFQDSPFHCKENAMAITKLEETLLWLRKRTMGREQKGIEGTHKL